jgi:hypothetical protein
MKGNVSDFGGMFGGIPKEMNVKSAYKNNMILFIFG